MTQQNDFVVFCACAAGFFLMLGSMSLQFGMALTGMAICLPFQIAVSLSVGEPSSESNKIKYRRPDEAWGVN